MRMFYNGVELKVISTLPGTKRESVYNRDRTQYLYTHWTLDFICLYNPGATSLLDGRGGVDAALAARFTGAPLIPTTSALATALLREGTAARTDTAFRDLLRQDRGKLAVFSESGQLLLESPLPLPAKTFATLATATGVVTTDDSYEADATGGPHVLRCDIIEVVGVRSFVVRWTVETDLAESTGDPAKVVLSHRWTSRADVSQDQMATRVIRGELVFRRDELLRRSLLADQFRRVFGWEVPQHFIRTGINVMEHSDGVTVEYEIVDTERHFNLGPGSPATRFECFLTGNVNAPSYQAERLLASVGLATQFAGTAASAAQNQAIGGARAQAGLFALVQTGISFASAALQVGMRTTPMFNHTIVVRAWGPRQKARMLLHFMCIEIAFGRLGNPREDPWRSTNVTVTHEMSGKFVEVSLTYAFGLEDFAIKLGNRTKSAGGFLGNVIRGITGGAVDRGTGLFGRLEAPFKGSEDLKYPNLAARATQTDIGNPAFPDGGTRGNWLGNLVAQTLHESGRENPPDVPGNKFEVSVDVNGDPV